MTESGPHRSAVRSNRTRARRGSAASDKATPKPIGAKTPDGRSGLESPPVVPRTAGRESPDPRGIGPRAAERAGNGGRSRLDPRNGSGNTAHWMAGPSSPTVGPSSAAKRDPTAFHVGKPPCHPVGWLPRRKRSRQNRLPFAPSQGGRQAEWAEAGPGREQIAEKSARYPQSAHAANSRFAARAGCFFAPTIRLNRQGAKTPRKYRILLVDSPQLLSWRPGVLAV
jgi:hypothetical protein